MKTTCFTWTSIEDSIPPHGAKVIVAHKFGVSEAECWRGNSSKENVEFHAPYYGQEMGTSFDDVTHWTLMPQHPYE